MTSTRDLHRLVEFALTCIRGLPYLWDRLQSGELDWQSYLIFLQEIEGWLETVTRCCIAPLFTIAPPLSDRASDAKMTYITNKLRSLFGVE